MNWETIKSEGEREWEAEKELMQRKHHVKADLKTTYQKHHKWNLQIKCN